MSYIFDSSVVIENMILKFIKQNKRPPQILCKLHKQCIIKANEWRKKKWAEKEHLRKRQNES